MLKQEALVLAMSICLKKVALNTRPSLVVIRSVGKATSLHTVMLTPKLMLENTAPGVAHIMALQFSRVVGKTTSLYTVMFIPKLGLETMDPGMPHQPAVQQVGGEDNLPAHSDPHAQAGVGEHSPRHGPHRDQCER